MRNGNLLVQSDCTGLMEEATICPGLVGCDGIRRGAIADVDLFDMFDYRDGETEVDFVEELMRYRKQVKTEAEAKAKRTEAEERELRIERYRDNVAQFGRVFNEDAEATDAGGDDSSGDDDSGEW